MVAAVTQEPRLRMTWREGYGGGYQPGVPRHQRRDSDGPEAVVTAPDPSADYREAIPAGLAVIPLRDAFRENLRRIEVACQKGLCERFDASIGAATVNMPFAGRYQNDAGGGMVAKLPVFEGETDDATAMAYGFIPGHFEMESVPWSGLCGHGFSCEARGHGCRPADARLTFQEYFERLREDPRRWGQARGAARRVFSPKGDGGPLHRREGFDVGQL